MVTQPIHLASDRPKLLEFSETPKQEAIKQLEDDPSTQKAQFLNKTKQAEADRHLEQTYSLRRRFFL
jgi:hypothetical protein